jgi:hypothetical protein
VSVRQVWRLKAGFSREGPAALVRHATTQHPELVVSC